MILIKYGGNAMKSEEFKQKILQKIAQIHQRGIPVVLVHGGGPFIRSLLEKAKVPSSFKGGHRVTSKEAMRYVEMALKGEVNGDLVRMLNQMGVRAVGLSGKDGNMVTARKYYLRQEENGQSSKTDLGQVGEVAELDPQLIQTLLDSGYLPVVTCLASDQAGDDFNINADLFAGYLAGALKVDHYLVLTDIDGLRTDIDDPSSVVSKVTIEELPGLIDKVAKGGMLPKLESCRIALNKGASNAHIIDGTRVENISTALFSEQTVGTRICL
jgi:acetylglutamate kinase